MGAKALYNDTRRKIIHQLIISKNIDKIRGILHDRDEYKKYARDWKPINLDEFVSKLKITDDKYNMQTNMRKISFLNDGKTYEIVSAIGGKYFRIQEINEKGLRKYVDINLKEPSIPGNIQGAARRAERNRLTHFRMSYRKGTV